MYSRTMNMATTSPDQPVDLNDPYNRTEQIFPTLTEEQIERIKPFGEMQSLEKGTMLFERGERNVDFFVVLQGCVEIYDYASDGTHVITVHGERQFTGELDLFNDREILVGGRMGADGQVIRLSRDQFRKLITAEPDVNEMIMQAFILRRMGLITHKQASVTVVSAPQSSEALRIERFLERNGYPLEVLDAKHEKGQQLLQKYDVSPEQLPMVFSAQQRRNTLPAVQPETGASPRAGRGDQKRSYLRRSHYRGGARRTISHGVCRLRRAEHFAH